MKFVNLHTHKFSNQENILEIVNQYPQEFDETIPNYSIGIHPWHINKGDLKADLQVIDEKLNNKNCLALGECGLDKRIEIPFDLQIEVFEKQVSLAIKHKKPLILHCVGAFQEIIAIKKGMKIEIPMIIHGFSKNEQTAKQLIENGFYLSFGKYLIQSRSLGTDLETVFQNIPNDRFFLETDSSDYKIEEVYILASKYKNIEILELQNLVQSNFKKVFKS
jgi:TatD DNase family protein